MANIFKKRFGISIGRVVKDRMGVFMENGIHYMEFYLSQPNDKEFSTNLIKEVIKEREKYGFEVRTCHLPHAEGFDLSVTDIVERFESLEKQKEVVRWLSALEPKILVLHSSRGEVTPEMRAPRKEALIKSLKEFAPYCKKMGMQIALENLTPGSLLMSSGDLLEVIEAVGEDNIGICFDVNHLFAESHREFIKNAGKHIITMHISDNDGIRERHFEPGDGVLDWHEIFTLMDELNYDSTMICELGSVLSGFPDSVPVLKEKLKDVTSR